MMADLEIYVLNVGQADTAIIKTPGGRAIVIDAVRPQKVENVLEMLQIKAIAHLIITHPHWDHYSGVSRLLKDYPVHRVTLAPFWYEPGTSGYHKIINRIQAKQMALHFLSGYERTYPDGGTYPAYDNQLYLELLGPSNSILKTLHDSAALTPNHLSIIARLTYGKFSIVFAADAQMENWAHYDQEGMLAEKCDVLKAAHHGSKRGNQWERLERLSPSLVIVSSDPDRGHHLPDLIGDAIFLEYDRYSSQRVALTRETGSLKIAVSNPNSGRYDVMAYRDTVTEYALSRPEVALPVTDWTAIMEDRLYKE